MNEHGSNNTQGTCPCTAVKEVATVVVGAAALTAVMAGFVASAAVLGPIGIVAIIGKEVYTKLSDKRNGRRPVPPPLKIGYRSNVYDTPRS